MTDLGSSWKGWGPEQVRHRHKVYGVGFKEDGTDVELEFVSGFPYVREVDGTLFKRTEREDDRGRRIYEERP